MITKYKTYNTNCCITITRLKIERETDLFVWFNGTKEARNGVKAIFHASYDDALNHLINKSDGKVTAARYRLDEALTFQAKVSELKLHG